MTDVTDRLDRIERRIRELQDELEDVRMLVAVEPPTGEPAAPPPATAVLVLEPPAVREPFPRAVPAAPPPPPPAPARPAPAAGPAPPQGPSLSERLGSLGAELTGARGFAVAGGVVMLLGVVFLFVLAANRGWIGPVARVSIGAIASLAVLAAGIVLRIRYGRLQASLAAVGTGIAGLYATLAAATIIYGFLPNWGALLAAAAIAAAGGVLALRWSSQLLAGLSLVGAAAAPGLVALDDGVGTAGTAFAVVVLAAALAAAAPRRWLWLVVAVGGVSLAQVAWLTAEAPAADAGAIAVVAAASLVLLGGGIAWQAAATAAGLDPVAATLMLLGGGLAFAGIAVLLPDNREAGVALAIAAVVYAAAGCAAARRWRDLGWVAGCVGLLLVGIATAYVFSERSLTVAWAIEAAVLAVLAWRLGSPRFELASLAYIALGIAHLVLVDLHARHPVGDVPRSAAVGLYALAGAVLVAGVLAVGRRNDPRSVGLLAPLEPLWDDLVRTRGTLRLWLWCAVVALGTAGTAALASGRWLTVSLALTAAALALAAFALGERRFQAAGLAFLAVATVHALDAEAKTNTLVLSRAADALAPVPSLAAVAAASAVLAMLAGFADRGIAFLGPLDGAEKALAQLGLHVRAVRNGLLAVAAWFAIWAAGLLLVAVSYEPGQVGATALWAAAGTVTAAAAARRRSTVLALAAVPPTLLAYGKAVGFDWHELGSPWGPTAVLVACAGLLLVGFFARYAAVEISGVEFASLGAAVVATVSTLTAIDRLAPDRTRVLGAAAILLAFVVGALAVPPFRAWRQGRSERWLRDFATVYWSVALATGMFGELCIVDRNRAATVTLWALSGALVATAARPLSEERFWLAGIVWSAVASIGCLAVVTTPSRLFASSTHPGGGIWALAACVGALAWIAWLTPDAVRQAQRWILVVAVALGVFGFSLGVLEIAERVSGASVQTDFQRGHTAVSALWGVLALGLFVAGLARGERTVQRIGLALFGLALAKLFLYDLRNLSSITRALSFLAVGAILLTAAFFVERIVRGDRGGPRVAP